MRGLTPISLAIGLAALAGACGGSKTADAGNIAARDGDAGTDDDAPPSGDGGSAADAPGVVNDSGTPDAADVAATGGPSAAELLALTRGCQTVVSDHPYATDTTAAANIQVCGLPGAVFWTADMDVTCNGRNVGDDKCPGDDCCYSSQTAFTSKSGRYLAASVTPYVVIPIDFRPNGLAGGAVVAVIYGGKVVYAVFGDTGSDNVIGQASYACAAALGIDPDPAKGGTAGPVTYIAFLGSDAVPADIEDREATERLGERLAAALLRAP